MSVCLLLRLQKLNYCLVHRCHTRTSISAEVESKRQVKQDLLLLRPYLPYLIRDFPTTTFSGSSLPHLCSRSLLRMRFRCTYSQSPAWSPIHSSSLPALLAVIHFYLSSTFRYRLVAAFHSELEGSQASSDSQILSTLTSSPFLELIHPLSLTECLTHPIQLSCNRDIPLT